MKPLIDDRNTRRAGSELSYSKRFRCDGWRKRLERRLERRRMHRRARRVLRQQANQISAPDSMDASDV